jgi:hypothetical protein
MPSCVASLIKLMMRCAVRVALIARRQSNVLAKGRVGDLVECGGNMKNGSRKVGVKGFSWCS